MGGKRMLLRVSAPHFVAAALHEKRDGEWKCIAAAPIIAYQLASEVACFAPHGRGRIPLWTDDRRTR